MTLHKQNRDPLSESDVWAQYIEFLGAKVVCDLIGKGKSAVYGSADPDRDYIIGESFETRIWCYQRLDAACLKAGYHQPFMRWHEARVGFEARQDQTAEHLDNSVMELSAAEGEVAPAYLAYRRNPCLNTANTLKQCLQKVRDEGADAIKAVDAEQNVSQLREVG